MNPPAAAPTRTLLHPFAQMRRPRVSRRDAGLSLVEVLVALAVLGLATTGLLHLHAELSSSTAQWRETSRALQVLRSHAEARRADPVSGLASEAPAGSIRSHVVGEGVTGELVLVSPWTDRLGAERRVSISMQWPLPDVELADLADASRPGRWPAPVPFATSLRHPAVPREARDLGADTAFAPATLPGLAGWILDRRTGAVQAACASAPVPRDTGVAAAPSTAGPQSGVGGAGDGLPDGCAPLAGRLMTGTLRFSLGASPSWRGPFDEPLPLALVLRGADGRVSWPGCEVAEVRGDDAHLAWRCFVPAPSADAPPPSRPTVLPQGWSMAGDAASHRVCWAREATRRASWRGPVNALVVRAMAACPPGTVDEQD
jgi:prepilin-type N-terminal cleavage/methylation domain-containing protein